jgi:hypothetical protein
MSWTNDPRPWRDEEYPEPDPDEDSDETVPCPECGALIYEDASQCPHCSTYISPSTSVWQGRSLLWIALGLLGITGTIIALLGLVP